MAGVIDQLVSASVFTNFEKFIQGVGNAQNSVFGLTNEVDGLVSKLHSLKSMTDVQQFLGQMQQTQQKINAADQLSADIQKQLIAERAKNANSAKQLSDAIERLRKIEDQLNKQNPKGSASRKQRTAEEIATANAVRQLTKEQVLNLETEKLAVGSIARMRKELQLMLLDYDKLGDRSTDSANKQFQAIQKLSAELSNAEQSTGRFGRNVGNYQSALNGFNVSLAQVIREVPNAAISTQTFFLSISNNLPMLTESIHRLNAQNAQLKANGEATIPVWKTLAKGLLSWNSLIVVGVTLLTAFGSKIVGWIGNLIKGKESLDAAITAQERFNKSISEGVKNANEGLQTFNLLYKASQDNTRSIEDRKRSVDEMQKLYPQFLENLSDEEILAGKAASAYNKIAKNIVNVAIARAKFNEIVKLGESINEVDKKIEEAEKKAEESSIMANFRQERSELPFHKNAMNWFDAYLATLERNSSDTQGRIVDKLKETRKSYEEEIRLIGKSINILDLFPEEIESSPKSTKATKSTKVKVEPELVLENYDTWLPQFIDTLIKDIENHADESDKRLQIQLNLDNADLDRQYLSGEIKLDEYENRKAEIQQKYSKKSSKTELERLKELLNNWKGNAVAQEVIQKQISKTELQIQAETAEEEAKIQREKLEDYKKYQEQLRQTAIATWNDISNSVGQIAAGMSERRMQEIDDEAKLAELEAERVQKSIDDEQKRLDNAIMTDEQRALHQEMLDAKQEAAEEKKRLKDAQIEQKRRMEEVRMARFEKTRALMEANVATAVSVANSAKIGFPLAIPFIIMASVAGAAQTAAILAQPLPKYAKGGRDIPEGLAIVGDAGKHEIYQSPTGELAVTPKTPTIITAEKGANIYPDMRSFMKSQLNEIGTFRPSKSPEGLTDEHVQTLVKELRKSRGDVRVNMTRHGTLDVWMRDQKRLKVLGNELFI